MSCKHDVKALVGCAGGICCKACGKTFASYADVLADRKESPNETAQEQPKVEEKPKAEKKPATAKKPAAKKPAKR